VRASVLATRENLYVEAARALGSRDPSILTRYILPNVVAPLVVTATLGLGTAILAAATLSFLGLGSQPPHPEWGRMLSEGRDYLREAWWISTFPGLGIMLTVLGITCSATACATSSTRGCGRCGKAEGHHQSPIFVRSPVWPPAAIRRAAGQRGPVGHRRRLAAGGQIGAQDFAGLHVEGAQHRVPRGGEHQALR
jgi:hypothetical protein